MEQKDKLMIVHCTVCAAVAEVMRNSENYSRSYYTQYTVPVIQCHDILQIVKAV